MKENEITAIEDSLESEIWLPLKEAAARARRTDATVKRAIKGEKLVGRKVGVGHNASYEVTMTSLNAWMATQAQPESENSEQASQKQKVEFAESPANTPADTPTITQTPSKAERRKQKAARRKDLPESARRLRRWKNFMRHADQRQALAMIQWLSARLAPTKSLSKKILKEALKLEKTQSVNPS